MWLLTAFIYGYCKESKRDLHYVLIGYKYILLFSDQRATCHERVDIVLEQIQQLIKVKSRKIKSRGVNA